MWLFLIDDDPRCFKGFARFLHTAGYDVVTLPRSGTNDAVRAIDAIRQARIDLPIAIATPSRRDAEHARRPESAIDNRVQQVLRIIDDEFAKPIELQHLAERVNLGRSRLQHLFSRAVGMPIRAYVRHRRLRATILLIEQTNLRISEICFRVGFNDLAHFDRVFRREFGESPTMYRRRLQQPIDARAIVAWRDNK